MDARGSPKATAVLREIAESTLAFGPNVDPARAYQLDCRRRMSPGEKPADAASLCWSARRLKATFLRQQYAEWSEEQVEHEVRRVFTHARDSGLPALRAQAERAGYMVTGSGAGLLHGEPRVTHDIDIVLPLRLARIQAFASEFPLEDFYRIPRRHLPGEPRSVPRPGAARASTQGIISVSGDLVRVEVIAEWVELLGPCAQWDRAPAEDEGWAGVDSRASAAGRDPGDCSNRKSW